MVINKLLIKLKETDPVIFDLTSQDKFLESLNNFSKNLQQFKLGAKDKTTKDFDFIDSEMSIHENPQTSIVEIGLWYGITIGQLFIQCKNDDNYTDLYDSLPIIRMTYPINDYFNSAVSLLSNTYKNWGKDEFKCIRVESKNRKAINLIIHEDGVIYTVIVS